MCHMKYRRIAVAAAAFAVGAAVASLASAQYGRGGGPGGGGMPGGGMPATGPGSLFKKAKENREVVGLSAAATNEPVVDVRIVGNKLVPTSQILNEMQTRVGRPYDPTMVQRDVRKLNGKPWFVAVDADIKQTPEGWVVTLKVAERPTIRYVEYLGNETIRDKKLEKETGLKVGGSVDPYAVEEARRKIIDLYRKNGFNDTQVSILEGNKGTDDGIVFVINEGNAQKIWKVEFVGAEFVSGRRLKTQVESKPPLLMVFKGFVDREQIDEDVKKLTAWYRSYGFFQAKVGRKLEYNEKGSWATLVFVVHEGPRYDVRNVSYMGNEIFASTSLATGMKMPAGEPFEQAKMNTDVRFLKDLYGSQGYVFADIQAEPIFLEEPGKIDLVYHVEEGKQWKVGRIFVHIAGDNSHTRIQTALNRLSFHPGEIVDIREIHASERRMQASSLFLTDPARGTAPKITYKIQNLNDDQLASEADDSFRGQSPEASAAPKLRPIAAAPGTARDARYQSYEVPLPAGCAPGDDSADVHLYFDEPQPVAPAGDEKAPADDELSTTPEQKFVVRTQSPYQAATTQASPSATYPPAQSAVAANGAAVQSANPYGGLPVRATGPDSLPAGYNAQAAQSAPQVQPAQYGELLPSPPQAPGGPVFGSPPMGPQPVGPPPGIVADPNITPLPNDPRLFPSGHVEPWAKSYDDRAVDIFVDAAEAQTGRLMLGVAVNSDAGLFGQILLDEQNFDYKRFPTSMEEVVNGRAWRGAGQRFRLEAMPGTQVQRYIATFQEPYLFDTPVSFGLSGSYYTRRYRDWNEQRLGGRTSLGYQWTADDVSTTLSYRGENIKIYNPSAKDNPATPLVDESPDELDEALGSNALHGFKIAVANDTRDSAFFPTSGHYAEVAVEQVVGSFVYPRGTADVRNYHLLRERPDHSGRHILSLGTQIGLTTNDSPIYDNFYAGGYSTLRGFKFRGASPVETTAGNRVQVGGELMWVNSVEYIFPFTADDMMHGVVFCDFGTVERNINIDWDNFRVSPGFGLRLTIPAMGPAPIALDFAFPVVKADTDDQQVFSFNIGYFR